MSTAPSDNHAVSLADILTNGSYVRFREERIGYHVRASNSKFAVCTKPFSVMGTVLYTVIDYMNGVRGRENLVFGMGAETDDDCARMLERLSTGDSEVSFRYRIPLNIMEVKSA